MKNIEPINAGSSPEATPPPAPEASPPPPQPAAVPETPAPAQPEAPEPPEFNPYPTMNAPSTPQPSQTDAAIPPLGVQDSGSLEGVKIGRSSNLPPISVAVMSVLLLIYGIFTGYLLVQLVFASAALDFLSYGSSFFLGEGYRWLSIGLNFVIVISVLVSSLHIWRGSKVALAFVGGLSLLSLQTFLISILFTLSILGSIGTRGTLLLIAIFAFIVSQVLCWTKDRSYFS